MKNLFKMAIIGLTLSSFCSFAEEEESPDAMDPTGNEDPQFIGERVPEDPTSNVHDLKSEVNSLKVRMDELLREIAVLKRDKGSSPDSEMSTYHAKSDDIGQATHTAEESEEDEVLKMLDEASLTDAGSSEKSPVEKKRIGATTDAEKNAPTLPSGNAQAQYNEALALYKKAAYPEASRAFHYVIKAYPKNSVAKKSHYWLGECSMSQNKNGEARKHYAKAYEIDKKGPNSADCLYKLGLTFANEKKKTGACTAWKKLTIDYPSMSKSLKEKVTKAQKTHKCS